MSNGEQRGGFDAEAFVRHLRGESPLPDEVVDAHYRALRAYWQRIAYRRRYPSDLFEDAAHDTWLKMSKRIASLDEPRHLPQWANAIFVNCMLDLVTARPREQADNRVGEEAAAVPMWCQRRSQEDEERWQEEEHRLEQRLAIVERFVETLAGNRREVWTRYMMQNDQSSEEVAETIGLSADRVRQIASKLKRQLAAALHASADSASE